MRNGGLFNASYTMDKLSNDLLIEFLEVSFHNILYLSNIYPKEIFENRKKYGAPVKYSIHPQVNSYILNTLNAAKEILSIGSIDKIALCFIGSNGVEIQRFVYKIDKLVTNMCDDDPYFVKCEQMFRGHCLKLSNNNLVTQLPEDATFLIQIYTNESSAIHLIENPEVEKFPLIEMSVNKSGSFTVLPLDTIDVNAITVQIYMEC